MDALATGTEGPTLPDLDEGVALVRLLDRAKPSLAEAAALATAVLEAVNRHHGRGRAHGGLDSRSVHVGLDGAIRLTGGRPDTKFPAGPDDDVRRADVRATAVIVAEIAASAGRPSRPLTGPEDRLVARLSSAADPRSLTRRGLLKAAHALDAAVGPPDARVAVRRRLVSLIRAVAAVEAPQAPGAVAPTAALRSVPPPAATPPTRRPMPPPARRPPIWPRVGKGVAVAAAVALVLGVELRLYGDRVSHNLHVLLSGTVHQAPTAPAARRPGPVPALGPAAAGPVTHLELRALDGCRGGGTCNGVVQVTVASHDRPLDVAFGLEVVDRCPPGRESRPGGVLSVPPGQDRAAAPVTLALPAGRALAVIPLTTSPVTVAGTPLRTPGDDAC